MTWSGAKYFINFAKTTTTTIPFLILSVFDSQFAADKLYREREKLSDNARTEEEKMKVHEKMGDVAANTGLFKTAIKYYQKMVSERDTTSLVVFNT